NCSPQIQIKQGGNVAAVTAGSALKTDASATTQPVSAASLPLPSGASTAAKQPALGTAGTPSADVITVQGITSMTALKTDGSAVTQPVSGTVAVNQGTAGASSWPVIATPQISTSTGTGWTSGTAGNTTQSLMSSGGWPALLVQLNQTSTIS